MLAYEFYPHIMGSHSVSRGVASSQFCFKTVTKAAMHAIEDLRFFLVSYASSCLASQHSVSQVPPNPQRQLPRVGHFLASTGWLRVGHKQQLTWACPTAPPKRPQIQHTWWSASATPEQHPISSINDTPKPWTEQTPEPCYSRSHSVTSAHTHQLIYCSHSQSSWGSIPHTDAPTAIRLKYNRRAHTTHTSFWNSWLRWPGRLYHWTHRTPVTWASAAKMRRISRST